MIIIDIFYSIMSTLGLLSDQNTNPAASGTSEPSRDPDVSRIASANNTTPETVLIPDSILAFRTISLLLSQLQNCPKLTYVPCTLSQEEEKEVKIGDAFAHLAVVNHDVVAIATQRSRSLVEVMAVSEGTSEGWGETSILDTTSEQVLSQAKYRVLDMVYQFFFTKNPQFKE